jgi:YggT family protein
VALFALLITFALTIFIILMWIRLALDLVATYSRNWRPRGFLLVVAEVVFSVTDPPVKFVRRFIKPVRFGEVSIDFSWTIVVLVAIILSSIVSRFMI